MAVSEEESTGMVHQPSVPIWLVGEPPGHPPRVWLHLDPVARLKGLGRVPLLRQSRARS